MRLQKIQYDPLPYQQRFQDSEKRYPFLCTGYGGGKTYSLCMKALKLCHQNWGLPGGLLCPTLKQFKRDVNPTFQQIFTENGIRARFHKSDYYYTIYPTKSQIWIYHSEDDGASIKGSNLAFALINEVTLCTKPAFEAMVSRVRLKAAKMRQIAMSGTPEFFSFAKETFVDDPIEGTDLINGDARLNIHVAEDYYQMLIDSYGEKLVQQYVLGKWVNLSSNLAAHSFDRHAHVRSDIEKIPGLPVWISVDFNVDPMTATLFNRMPPGERVTLQAFDEIKMPGSNTYELVKAIRERLDPGELPYVYPDPAGKARSTRTRGETDISILADGLYESSDQAREFIKHKRSIQSVRDCLNALNNELSKRRILVSDRCKDVIADFERCIIKPGTFEIDKSDTQRSHWLDGIKNMIDFEFPLKHKLIHWQKKIR